MGQSQLLSAMSEAAETKRLLELSSSEVSIAFVLAIGVELSTLVL
jgi:hypothetical protein